MLSEKKLISIDKLVVNFVEKAIFVATLATVAFAYSGPRRAFAQQAAEVEKDTNDVNIFPVPVVFFTPETGIGAGGGLYITYGSTKNITEENNASGADGSKPELGRNLLIPFLIYTEKNQAVGRLYWSLWAVPGKTRLNTVLSYTNYPDSFFGIGNDTERASEETFREVYEAADLEIEQKIFPNVFLGIAVRSENFEVLNKKPLGLLDAGLQKGDEKIDIIGADGGSIRGAGLQIRLLRLNHEYTPTSGYNFLLRRIEFGESLGGQFRYTADELRLRLYIPALRKDSVAVEVLAQQANGDVPFRKLPMLGGQFLLRGFFAGRFRDSALLAVQSEYRHVVTDKIGANAFVSGGTVGPDFKTARDDHWHISAGVGLRYIIVAEDNLGLRLDIARNDENIAIYFGAGEVF